MRGDNNNKKGQRQDDANTTQDPGTMRMGEQRGHGNKEGEMMMRGDDGGRVRMGERQGVGGMMMAIEYTTIPQPHKQLLVRWAAGGITMTPMTAPWTTTTSHCSWGGRGVLVRYGCVR